MYFPKEALYFILVVSTFCHHLKKKIQLTLPRHPYLAFPCHFLFHCSISSFYFNPVYFLRELIPFIALSFCCADKQDQILYLGYAVTLDKNRRGWQIFLISYFCYRCQSICYYASKDTFISHAFFHWQVFLNKTKYFVLKICCDKIRPLRYRYRDSQAFTQVQG